MSELSKEVSTAVGHEEMTGPAQKTSFEWTEPRLWIARILMTVALLSLWQFASGRLISTFWFSDPLDIGRRLVSWIKDGTLLYHFTITMEEVLIGFSFGVTLGSAAGLFLGRQKTLMRLLDPFILGIYSLPKIALAPLFILWFGIGILPKIVLAGAVVFFLVFFNALAGTRDVDADLIDTVRMMGGSRWQVMRFVLVPSALVWVFTGLKISVPYALVGAVVGEMMASNKGLGALIQDSASQFDTAGVFAALAVLLAVSVTFNESLGWLERRVLRWKQK